MGACAPGERAAPTGRGFMGPADVLAVAAPSLEAPKTITNPVPEASGLPRPEPNRGVGASRLLRPESKSGGGSLEAPPTGIEIGGWEPRGSPPPDSASFGEPRGSKIDDGSKTPRAEVPFSCPGRQRPPVGVHRARQQRQNTVPGREVAIRPEHVGREEILDPTVPIVVVTGDGVQLPVSASRCSRTDRTSPRPGRRARNIAVSNP